MNINIESLIAIAKQLGELYSRLSTKKSDLKSITRQIEERELEITPPDGWPGKNAEAREIEQKRTFKSDVPMQGFLKAQFEAEVKVSELEAQIAGLEAERRAIEHIIYARNGDALNGLRNRHNAPALGQAAQRDTLRTGVTKSVNEEIEDEISF